VPAPFALLIFETGFMFGPVKISILLFVLPAVAETTDLPHLAQSLVEMGIF
jgi:hypothetical protein